MRWVKSLGGLNYEERLKDLKLQSLGKNGKETDKVLYNQIDLEATQLFKVSRRPGLRRSSLKLPQQTGRTRRIRSSFACRIVKFATCSRIGTEAVCILLLSLFSPHMVFLGSLSFPENMNLVHLV